jgi:hypothetical protein
VREPINIFMTIDIEDYTSTNKIDLLIIFPCNATVLDNVNEVMDYNSMQAHFICQALRSTTLTMNIVCVCIPDIWKPKGTKNKISFARLTTALNAKGIAISNCHHLLITTLNSSRQYGKDLIDNLLLSISGNVYKFEDRNIRISNNNRLVTIGHYSKGPEEANFINAGIAVPTSVFVPQQDHDSRVYRVHVDHNYPNVASCFDEIKTALMQLQEKIYQHSEWDSLEVIYHTRVSEINEIGHFNTTNVSIGELARIYGRCHLAFLSHRESLGQYPFEMAAAGASVIVLKKKYLPVIKSATTAHRVQIEDVNYDMFLNKAYVTKAYKINQYSVAHLGYDRFVRNFLDAMFNISSD